MRRTSILALFMAAPVLLPLAGAARGQEPAIDVSVCRFLPRHVPAPDVAFRPGAEMVNGRPVAPADLPGSPGATTGAFPVEIPLTPALARRLGLSVPTGPLPRGAEIGALTIAGDRVLLRGCLKTVA